MITVPDKTILAVPYDDYYRGKQDHVFVSLVGHNQRPWFNRHAYYCLPLTIGNQYGFAVRSMHDFTVIWDGGGGLDACKIEILSTPEPDQAHIQKISSHFGMGVITVQTAFTLRSPPMVNLITMNPPNSYIDGLTNLTGVVEADNLRRDFTFNLKLTRPGHQVRVNKGDLLSAFLPYPRDFFEHYQLRGAETVLTDEEIHEEQRIMREFGRERSEVDVKKPHGNGRRYHRGVDIEDTPFPNLHQKNLTAHRKKRDG